MQLMVRTSDGRRLSINDGGHPAGRPVFLLHGTPGSRFGPAPRERVLYHLGVRLITFDRPGYGDSDRLPGRTVSAAAADVRHIADALGIGRFAVVGRSGGAPHALACAALLPDRTTRAAALVSLAPRDAPGLHWFDGMTESNVREYVNAAIGRSRVTATLGRRSRSILADPAASVAEMAGGLPESDRWIVADAGIQDMLVRNFAEGLRSSPDGWVDDVMAFSTGWGFDLGRINTPVKLWHGEDDIFAPVEHTRWLGRHIPDAEVEVERGAAHFGALRVLTRVLSWAVS
ncbi:alpha/beta fold hydrolase [Streptomyces neyagawaensis]|uniref:alpha/beta fold hydrolase n=1 Tax=Streptomyces neyagawaensis TaxID=42238 RepID=UPI0006E18FCD|nr:alpha/beta hydrolase [Streptomyces neyagawaensis]MCL6734270.1 alpha/beta hydrolase [Streptomyces neyagawaensis]MDE1681899.1 alpha/beta hydrolase [Streptomyces neyagawaensis]